MKYYCKNCGSEIDLQDSVWLGDNKKLCPLCGSEDSDLQEIPAYETIKQWEKRKGRKYPDTASVYIYLCNKYWFCIEFGYTHRYEGRFGEPIVATEAGAPPKGWRME